MLRKGSGYTVQVLVPSDSGTAGFPLLSLTRKKRFGVTPRYVQLNDL